MVYFNRLDWHCRKYGAYGVLRCGDHERKVWLLTISRVGGLIAAASKKASRPMLQLGGISVVERIVLTFQQAGVFPIVVVTGVEADEVKYRLAGRGVVFLHNEEFEDPELIDSVKIGLSFLRGKCERVVFSPVNTPMFLPSTLYTLLGTTGDIVTPSYMGRGGHPIIFSNAVIPNLLAWQGETGLRGGLASMSGLRIPVEVDDEGILLTIHQQSRLQAYYEENKASFLHPRLRLSLEREEELFNARAKLLLLLIGETHSVRTASAVMALSQSKAWDMLNKLEAALGYALITRRKGGTQGSRSDLTPEGLSFLKAWQRYEERAIECAYLGYLQMLRDISHLPS
ncbi:Regulatory protein LysR [uncultured Eubacteriales bacterium]|uniref:Regulatory protein LysR n=1 Tax=uncultured Eubacteriales bacterium TaxID=172733 RepID=A0A212J588_9FIRM|nr:Regulatory protein LysR [uncultured Eubacteriales bacterium]